MEVLFLSIVPKGELYTTLADEFNNNGHRVTFVSPTEGETRFEKYKNHSILYFHAGRMLNVSIPRKGINNLLFPFYCIKAIKKHIRPQDYQLILMSTPPLGYLSSIKYLKKRNPSIKFYEILRDIHPEGSTHILNKVPGLYCYFKRIANQLYQTADVIGCMSPYNVKLIQDRYLPNQKEKVQLLPNWGRRIEYQSPSYAIRDKYGLTGKYVIIYGGNMGKPQNLTLFLRLAKDKLQLRDVLFFFIGSGTEKPLLREIVKNENLTNVRIEDYIPQEDYNEVLRCADVGIITLHPLSFFANCPSKTISYWQNKIPILASLDDKTDHGTYFIDRSGSGLWSLATDFDMLSSNFDKLYYNADLRKQMGENGYKFFMENYTVDKAYDNIMNALNIK